MKLCKFNKKLVIVTFMLVMSVFLFVGTTAYASDDGKALDKLTIKEIWLTGDTLHVSVADSADGQMIELNLLEYAKPGDEYITINATDSAGRESNAITFKNPYYEQAVETAAPEKKEDVKTLDIQTESAISDETKPFTPDGTGTVLDNTKSENGKEFFTVETADGNVFYLIVDRQRDSENVYLLNAVNENDLASLAKTGDGKTISAIPTPTPPAPTPEPTPVPEAPKKPESNSQMLIFIGFAFVIAIGVGYYIKIVRPKKEADMGEYDDTEDYDDGQEFEIPDDEEGESK